MRLVWSIVIGGVLAVMPPPDGPPQLSYSFSNTLNKAMWVLRLLTVTYCIFWVCCCALHRISHRDVSVIRVKLEPHCAWNHMNNWGIFNRCSQTLRRGQVNHWVTSSYAIKYVEQCAFIALLPLFSSQNQHYHVGKSPYLLVMIAETLRNIQNVNTLTWNICSQNSDWSISRTSAMINS